jgi:hypothetical protein
MQPPLQSQLFRCCRLLKQATGEMQRQPLPSHWTQFQHGQLQFLSALAHILMLHWKLLQRLSKQLG